MGSTNTQIEWTDATWNPVTGCTKVSPGCAHCYAEGVALRFWASQYPPVEYGTYSPDNCCQVTEERARRFTDVQCHPERLTEPLSWRKPRKVFVNSMSDLFHEDVPFEFIAAVFGVMAVSDRHTFQVLTKRPLRMLAWFKWLQDECRHRGDSTLLPWQIIEDEAREQITGDIPAHGCDKPWPLPNVWLGVSVENQHFADERIPLLLQTPASVRFVSAEPLLGSVNLRQSECASGERASIDWVIVGGESGPKSRPFNVRWARDIVDQCRSAGVPVFVKQLGADVRDRNDAGFTGDEPHHWPEVISAEDRVEHDLDGTRDGYQGAPVRIHLRDRKGGDPAEWPEDLRVRQFPERLA